MLLSSVITNLLTDHMIDLTMILSVARLLRVTGLRSVRTASTATTNRKNLREEKLFDDIFDAMMKRPRMYLPHTFFSRFFRPLDDI
jgi:hypothetical protein